FPPHTLMAGITINGKAMAYPVADLQKQRLILDMIGDMPILIVLGDDNKSVRAFERKPDGRTLEFFVKPETVPLQLVDAETGTTWDFSGKAVTGPLAGKRLRKVAVLKDYWFDWKIYHPDTGAYTLGSRLNLQPEIRQPLKALNKTYDETTIPHLCQCSADGGTCLTHHADNSESLGAGLSGRKTKRARDWRVFIITKWNHFGRRFEYARPRPVAALHRLPQPALGPAFRRHGRAEAAAGTRHSHRQ